MSLTPKQFRKGKGKMSHRDYLRRRRTVLKRDGNRCVKCGSADDLTLDHIVPVSKGGSHAIVNLQTMCGSCNSLKGSSGPPELIRPYKEGPPRPRSLTQEQFDALEQLKKRLASGQ